MATAPHRLIAPAHQSLTPAQVQTLVAETCPPDAYRGQKVLLIIPDGTRTAPVDLTWTPHMDMDRTRGPGSHTWTWTPPGGPFVL